MIGTSTNTWVGEPTDRELLAQVRAGEDLAFGRLYERYEPAARGLARCLTASRHEADDVVADAFAKVLRAIRGGAGPVETFRAYLLTAVRRTAWRSATHARHQRLVAGDEPDFVDPRLAEGPQDHIEEDLVLRAFRELPARWQTVLWHTAIEGRQPAEVAEIIGLSPNATAALAVRAREGLRRAYLQAHLQCRPAESCRFTFEHLAAHVRGGLGKRQTAEVDVHLDTCGGCQKVRAELADLSQAVDGPRPAGVLTAA